MLFRSMSDEADKSTRSQAKVAIEADIDPSASASSRAEKVWIEVSCQPLFSDPLRCAAGQRRCSELFLSVLGTVIVPGCYSSIAGDFVLMWLRLYRIERVR